MDPYVPDHLPLDLSRWNFEKLIQKVSRASASLAYYDGILESMVNPSIFLSPLETKEAVLSSRIEGTVTTLDEVLRFEADMKPTSVARQNDIIEVLNYRVAMRHAKDWLERGLPFNVNMLCAIQQELMAGVRGRDKYPGEIRQQQVWIGPAQCKIEQATYVPPNPLGLTSHLHNLFEYLHTGTPETLIQTAIMHAQFEIIHPFMDGNGRTGRILIPLYLWHRKRIKSPVLYISEYLDTYRNDYTENLLRITQHHDWERWVTFFLDAIEVQARNNADKAHQVLALYSQMKELFTRISKSPYNAQALDTLFRLPLFASTDFGKMAGLNPQATFRFITRLKKEGILDTLKEPAGRSPEILLFTRLFDIIN